MREFLSFGFFWILLHYAQQILWSICIASETDTLSVREQSGVVLN
jgi:hypothetical protein